MTTQIQFLKGDATVPQTAGKTIIAHICNDRGGWGKGFVLAISKRWPEPERRYREWHAGRAGNDFKLGAVQFVQVSPRSWIANMIGQHGMGASKGGPPIRYDAVESCLQEISTKAQELSASVHMPRIGCGLAGGKWELIEPLIQKTLCKANVAVYIYDFGS